MEASRTRHERLVEQWRDIRRLYLAGTDLRDICRRLGISARTVYRYKDLEEPTPRPAYKERVWEGWGEPIFRFSAAFGATGWVRELQSRV